MRILALALLLLFAFSTAAVACLNDREAPRLEREYQRQYEPQQNYQPQQYALMQPDGSPVALASIGVGGALLAGSLLYSVFRKVA